MYIQNEMTQVHQNAKDMIFRFGWLFPKKKMRMRWKWFTLLSPTNHQLGLCVYVSTIAYNV